MTPSEPVPPTRAWHFAMSLFNNFVSLRGSVAYGNVGRQVSEPSDQIVKLVLLGLHWALFRQQSPIPCAVESFGSHYDLLFGLLSKGEHGGGILGLGIANHPRYGPIKALLEADTRQPPWSYILAQGPIGQLVHQQRNYELSTR